MIDESMRVRTNARDDADRQHDAKSKRGKMNAYIRAFAHIQKRIWYHKKENSDSRREKRIVETWVNLKSTFV